MNFWSPARRKLANWYWDLRGGDQSFSLDGYDARFSASTENGGDIIRWTYDIERNWLQALIDALEPEDILFDVGANLGFYSCFAMKALPRGRVLAFEPYPPNVRQLRKNMAMNGDNGEVYPLALSDQNGTLEFTDPGADVGIATGTIKPGKSDSDEQNTRVQTRIADELVEEGEIPQPTVVKIDVEGSEPRVIDGMKEILSNSKCRLLFCEIHLPKEQGSRPSVEDFNSSAGALKQKLRSLGFELVDISKRNRELHVRAEK